ncbi:MAG: VCBS repeat-containing protein, partial [Planctomycetes bacterium]|nr:VCBS repeat-containing protein [Planctomycetota bacterium]
MERSRDRRSCVVVSCLVLGACLPSVGGLVATRSGGSSSTIVNPTVAVAAPPANVASGSLQLVSTTTPAGQAIEGNLDEAGWQDVSSPWSLTDLAEGAHTAKVRIAGRPGTEQVVTWAVDTVAPSTPAGLTAVADRAGEIALSWTAATDGGGLAGYTIAYGTTSGSLDSEVTAAGDAIAHRLTGLSACQTYHCTIRSVDLAGNASAASAEVAARASCGGDGRFSESDVALDSSVDAVARGDFNGDGILDVAVSDADHVRILLGNGSDGRGDGTFEPGQDLVFGDWVTCIAVADLDADRIEDLAVVDSSVLRIYRGQGAAGTGDGTFVLHATVTTNLITPMTVLVRDFDSDRIPDLVVGDWSGSRLVVFTGNGSGGRGDCTFGYHAQVTTGAAPGALASGDFNADGIADLAVACQSGTEVLVTHLGNGSGGQGDGTFAAAQTWLSGGFVAGDVLVADMNGDRIDDLVVTLALANAVCFMAGSGSNGRGTGTIYLDEVVGVGTRPWGLVAGEFTGDNLVDYAAMSYLGAGVSLMTANGAHGRGDGSFTTATVGGEDGRLFHAIAGDVDGNG